MINPSRLAATPPLAAPLPGQPSATNPFASITREVGQPGTGFPGNAPDPSQYPVNQKMIEQDLATRSVSTPPPPPVQSQSPYQGRQYMPHYAQAIKDIESSGGNYSALGPVTRTGDRAYGAFQVMGVNIGPWSKEVLGVALTPEQFLSSPEAQEAIFAHKFGQYLDKFGDPGLAAQAWFAGPGGVGNLDASDGYNTVSQYTQKFNAALGRAGQYGIGGGGILAPNVYQQLDLMAQQIKGGPEAESLRRQLAKMDEEPEAAGGSRVAMANLEPGQAGPLGPDESGEFTEYARMRLKGTRERQAMRKANRRTIPRIERRSTPRNGETRNG